MTRRGFKALIVTAACIAIGAFCGNATAAVRLGLKLDKGKTYYERQSIDQQITQSIMGQEQIVSHNIGVGRKLDVLEVDAQGNMRIRYTYVWSKLKQTGPMGTTDYESTQSTPVPSGAEVFAGVIGQGYTLKVSPKGKVLDVNGVEELAQAVARKSPGVDIVSSQNPGTFLITKDGIREAAEGIWSVYPESPVEVGASWDQKKVTRMGLTMNVENKLTLQKRQGGVATIASTSTMKTDPTAPAMEMQGMHMKIEVTGTQEGTSEVDEATGLVKVERGHSILKGQIGIGTAPEGPFNMMTIPVTFDTKVTAEASDRMWEDKIQ